jgi:hypothetical protein
VDGINLKELYGIVSKELKKAEPTIKEVDELDIWHKIG